MGLYIYPAIRLHGVVLNFLSTAGNLSCFTRNLYIKMRKNTQTYIYISGSVYV
jgi:hypothetical protein